MNNWKNMEKIIEDFYKNIYLNSIHKFSNQINCRDSTGDHLRNSNNCKECFDFGGDNNENCKYVNFSGFNAKDIFFNISFDL